MDSGSRSATRGRRGDATMKRSGILLALLVASAAMVAWPEAQGAAPAAAAPQSGATTPAGARQGSGSRATTGGGSGARSATAWEYGVVKPLVPDARGWGWQTKSYVSASTPRPLWNYA